MDLRNENGWNMQHSELYARLGLNPLRHLPDIGIGPIDVDGILVYVKPKALATNQGRRRQGQTKRTFAICRCGTHVEAGHLHQHMKGRKCRLALGLDPILLAHGKRHHV